MIGVVIVVARHRPSEQMRMSLTLLQIGTEQRIVVATIRVPILDVGTITDTEIDPIVFVVVLRQLNIETERIVEWLAGSRRRRRGRRDECTVVVHVRSPVIVADAQIDALLERDILHLHGADHLALFVAQNDILERHHLSFEGLAKLDILTGGLRESERPARRWTRQLVRHRRPEYLPKYRWRQRWRIIRRFCHYANC